MNVNEGVSYTNEYMNECVGEWPDTGLSVKNNLWLGVANIF